MDFKERYKDIVKMGTDLYYGNYEPQRYLKFSLEESQSIFTKTLMEEAAKLANVSFDPKTQKLDFYTYSNPLFKHALFQLTSIAIDAIVPKVITDQFDRFAEVRNAAWNEQLIFEVSSPDLFTVSKAANGTTNVRRQRLDKRSVKLSPTMRVVKVYESIYRILSGQVNWAEYVNKVALSLATEIKNDIYTAIYDSYDATDSTYFYTGSFDGTTFNTMVAHVQAACGGLKPICYGTKLALAKVAPTAGYTAYPGLMSQNMLDQLNMSGYLGRFQGTDLIEIEQAHKPNSDTFAVSDSFLIIIPSGADRIVKIGFEGETIITESQANMAADQSIEHTVQKAWDVAVLSSGKFGIYRLS